MGIELNLLAILLGGVLSMVVGFIWYHPSVFGTAWMKALGISEKDLDPKPELYVGAFLSSLLMTVVLNFVLAHMMAFWSAEAWVAGALTGLLMSVGFTGTSMFVNALYQRQKPALFWVNFGYQTVTLVLIGIVLAVWR